MVAFMLPLLVSVTSEERQRPLKVLEIYLSLKSVQRPSTHYQERTVIFLAVFQWKLLPETTFASLKTKQQWC